MFSQRRVRIGDGTLQRATIHATIIVPSFVEGGVTLVPLGYGKRLGHPPRHSRRCAQ